MNEYLKRLREKELANKSQPNLRNLRMTMAEQLLDCIGDSDIIALRAACCLRYKMFVRLKDGRHRFQFHDDSYIDIYPPEEA